MASKDSVQRQSSLCNELRAALRSIRLSDEIKRTEIAKLRTELQVGGGHQKMFGDFHSSREHFLWCVRAQSFPAGATVKVVVSGVSARAAASLSPDTESSVAAVPERKTSQSISIQIFYYCTRKKF